MKKTATTFVAMRWWFVLGFLLAPMVFAQDEAVNPSMMRWCEVGTRELWHIGSLRDKQEPLSTIY